MAWKGDKKGHIAAGRLGYARRLAKMHKRKLTIGQIRSIQRRRSKRSITIDAKKTARRTYPPTSWMAYTWAKNPSRVDIAGIDTYRRTGGVKKQKKSKRKGKGKTYITIRKIRGERRRVKVTKVGGKVRVRVVSPRIKRKKK